MHIGVLTHNYPRFPGDFSGTFVEALCQEFACQQQQVTIWAPYDPAYQLTSAQSAQPMDLRLYRYIWPERLHQLGYMRSMQADLALRSDGYLLGPNMVAAGLVKLLREVRIRRPDILHAHWLLPNGFIGAVISRLTGIPLVISVPGSDAQIANANPLFRACARFAMRQASLMTANSTDLRDAVAALDPTVLKKFELIVYGTDPNVLKPDPTGVAELRGKLTIKPNEVSMTTDELYNTRQAVRSTFLILCVGRMVYKKGFDVFIRALAEPVLQEHNVIGVMVGEGDQKAEWQALAKQLGVTERLRWVGNVTKDEIGVYYNACDLLINPAVRKPVDGLNVCVLDAMSCGKPVIGSTVAGNPLAIVDGETGLLVPEGDATALAGSLARLADNPALVAQMGIAARQRIESELGWPPLARTYIAHFDRLVKGL